MRNPNFKSVKEAVKKMISRGGGTFLYKVPCATARLREEAAQAVRNAQGQDWPQVVTAVVVGVALKVSVTGTFARFFIAYAHGTTYHNMYLICILYVFPMSRCVHERASICIVSFMN